MSEATPEQLSEFAAKLELTMAERPGPWTGEPNRKEWRYRGMPCLAVRAHHGAWCGYVGVPPGHPWHGHKYSRVDVDVHGGLTYSSACAGMVCHVPAPGESDAVHWLGFDCAHAFDVVPAHIEARSRINAVVPGLGGDEGFWGNNVYRTLEYVVAQCEHLADQAIDCPNLNEPSEYD